MIPRSPGRWHRTRSPWRPSAGGAGAAIVLAGLTLACSTSASPEPPGSSDPPATEAPAAVESVNDPLFPAAPPGDAPTSAAQNAAQQSPQIPRFDSGQAWEHLRRQVAIGPRPAGSAALADCRRYLLEQLKAAGIDAREQAFDADTPIGRIRMVNVIGTIPGKRPERLALGSHYDTKLFREFRFVGANDGASSTAVLLELGRVLASRPNEYTIELLFFDGEEATLPDWTGNDHTYGSRHYVQDAKRSGRLANLKALVLLDMVGDRDLRFLQESNSTQWLNDIIWAAAAKLGHRRYFVNESFSIGGDDHFEFLAEGVPATDIIDLDYPAWHTAQDDLDHVSARSLQIVGDVVLAAIPEIERYLASMSGRR